MSRRNEANLKYIKTRTISVVCVPPKGSTCWLSRPEPREWTASDARQHAVHNPGHIVIYTNNNEIRYVQPREH